MDLPVIPSPTRFDPGGSPFAFRTGTTVACAAGDLGGLVERFCSDFGRRTGLRLAPGDPAAGGPGLTIELGPAEELDALPAPAGLSPAGDDPADERYSLTVDAGGIVLRAPAAAGVARGLTTLVQAGPTVAGGRILDGPRYAWRGLSLDLARTYLTLDEVRRVVDLLALYKLNVLHLHLTDDQAWRLPFGRGAEDDLTDPAFYEAGDLRALVAYAADRSVTLVPEVDTPGHASALVAMHPDLDRGRNQVSVELVPGHEQRTVWLDPEAPATFPLIEEVLAGVAGTFPGPYLHIGGDEPWGMPHDLYVAYVQRVREMVRSQGKRPLGWQESARAGLHADDVIQHWFTDIALPPSVPAEVRARLDAEVARSRQDVDTALAASAAVIVSPLSHCYLDVPYADAPADPAQAGRRDRAGLRLYPRRTVAESFDWDPSHTLGPDRAGRVAGVEAAVWCETVSGFDDLTFLLLPRLPGVAQRAWTPALTTWPDHRARLARHARLWDQDGLTYFRAAGVDWA
ncbi:MAG TPA: family 20 glycosylhydrolase [Acidimicrobiales bacterium]